MPQGAHLRSHAGDLCSIQFQPAVASPDPKFPIPGKKCPTFRKKPAGHSGTLTPPHPTAKLRSLSPGRVWRSSIIRTLTCGQRSVPIRSGIWRTWRCLSGSQGSAGPDDSGRVDHSRRLLPGYVPCGLPGSCGFPGSGFRDGASSVAAGGRNPCGHLLRMIAPPWSSPWNGFRG